MLKNFLRKSGTFIDYVTSNNMFKGLKLIVYIIYVFYEINYVQDIIGRRKKMKKKLISMMIISAMLLTSAAAFAEVGSTGVTKSGDQATTDIAKLPDENNTAEPAYVKNDLTVVKVEDGKIETINESIELTEDSEENSRTVYLNTHKAVYYDIKGDEIKLEDIKEGDSISVFTAAKEPTILIYPPVYTPTVIIKNDAEYPGSVAVSTFKKDDNGISYINVEGDLVVHLPEGFEANENEENDWIVFYTVTTRSIPPQTTPEKIVVLEKKEAEESNENTPIPTQLPVEFKGYSDVSTDNWYYDSVVSAEVNGIFKGVSETEFAPELSMTRAMFVTVLGRLDGIAVKDACVTGFEDTPGDQYYSSYVAWANINNIVKGYEDGTFKPDQSVTREEAMQILFNYCNYKEIGPQGSWSVLVDYADIKDISEGSLNAVMWNKIKKFMLTDENNNIRPHDEVTRAEVAYAMDVLGTILNN